MEGFWDGVETVSPPWVATKNPADGEVEALDGSVLLNGLNGILRAGGSETAGGRRQRGDESLVEADGKDEETAHISFFILRCTRAEGSGVPESQRKAMCKGGMGGETGVAGATGASGVSGRFGRFWGSGRTGISRDEGEGSPTGVL